MKLKSDYKVRKIAGESVIVRMGQQNVKMTTIISLNPTSEWLWEQLQGVEFDAEKVADLLTGEYEVEREVALKLRAGLLQLHHLLWHILTVKFFYRCNGSVLYCLNHNYKLRTKTKRPLGYETLRYEN